MKMFWFLRLIAFVTCFAIAEDVGVEDDDDDLDDEQTPESAVLEALDLDDESGDDEAEPSNESNEDNAESETNDTQESEQDKAAAIEANTDKESITDADLEPLNSKNTATNERFQKITEGFKAEKLRSEELSAENERYKGSIESLRSLGFSDETAANDLIEFSAYRHVLATGDAEQFKQIVATQVKQFELLHGKRVSIESNSLDDFPDLRTKVDNLDLDEDVALELARSRSVQMRASRDNNVREQNQLTQNQQQAVIDSAVNQVSSLQNNWQKSDPDYAAILPHLQPMMAEIGKGYPPSQWPQLIDMQYKTLKKALVQSAVKSSGALPLRGNGHMSGKSAPSSPEQAVLQAMGFE